MSESTKTTGYPGPERRRHRMYVTRNTEYHFRDGVCVAIRDRSSGNWQLVHQALHRRLSGSVRFNERGEGFPALAEPRVGDLLFFVSEGPDVVTSRLTAVERPEKQIVAVYPL